MHNSNTTSLKDSCKHYAQIINRIGSIRQHQAGNLRPVFMYQIQADGALNQVVQARVEGKADVQDLLMEYCKMNKPLNRGVVLLWTNAFCRLGLGHQLQTDCGVNAFIIHLYPPKSER